MILFYFLAWAGGGIFTSFMARDRRATSAFLASAAFWPICVYWFLANFGHLNPSSISEALIGALLISAIVGSLIAIFAGTGLAALWRHEPNVWRNAAVLAIAGGLLTFPIYASYRAPYGWERNFDDFPIVLACQTFIAYGVAGHVAETLKRSLVGPLVAVVVTLLPAIYYLPDIAFRMRGRGKEMNSLERVGARRAAADPRNATEGQRALAESGDPNAVSQLIDKIARADIEGREFDMVSLATQLAAEQRVRDALVRGLPIAIGRYREDNTFDETDRAIEAYCQALRSCVDERAVPDLIRAYRLSETNMNLRFAAAEALGNSRYKAAEPFILEELSRLHPIRDMDTAKKLLGNHSGDVRSVYRRFEIAARQARSRLRERDEPVRALIARGDMDAIVRRALSNEAGAGDATVELIKRKHPKRFEAVARHAGLQIRGADFTTFRDPELYRFLANRDLMAMENGHITRFICDWAPMESCALLGRLLKTDFASSAVVGLSHCPNSEAPKLLLGRLRVAKSGETLPYSLIRALGMKGYDAAAREIAGWADGKKTAGTFVTDGTKIEIGEVARWALSRMNSPEARALSARFPVRDASWLNKWKWS